MKDYISAPQVVESLCYLPKSYQVEVDKCRNDPLAAQTCIPVVGGGKGDEDEVL